VVEDLRHGAREIEVAAAGISHGLEQRLVAVVAHADRAGGHTPSPYLGGMRGQLIGEILGI
jgi:hypothetical protein